MRIIDLDTEKHNIVIGKSQIADNKIVLYGDKNNYPSMISALIDNSETAKSSANVLAQFIASEFVDETVGKTEIGKTFTGRAYTLNNLKRDIAQSISKFGGAYVMTRKNLQNQVIEAKIMRFEDCRFSKFDDNHFSNFVYYGDFSNTIKGDIKKKDAKKYAIFTDKQNVFEAQSKATGTTIQVYHIFYDNTYIYPFSPFDSVAYDMNSEYQIQVNRQQELTQGLSSKFIIQTSFEGLSDEEIEERRQQIQALTGSRGGRAILVEGEFNVDGSLADDMKVSTLAENRNANAFLDAEKSTANNIRKACFGLPAVLIDYESGNLSNNSGEQIKTAYEYYSRVTAGLREMVTEALTEIFENTDIPFASKNFELKQPTIE